MLSGNLVVYCSGTTRSGFFAWSWMLCYRYCAGTCPLSGVATGTWDNLFYYNPAGVSDAAVDTNEALGWGLIIVGGKVHSLTFILFLCNMYGRLAGYACLW